MKNDPIREWLSSSLAAGSPIEGLLTHALMLVIGFDMYERSGGTDPVLPMVALKTQHQVDAYRIDIALIGSKGGARVAIECDGHEFHERTKEQASSDKSRDRAIAAAGWRVLRFTGSEIWRNPLACAQEAFEVCSGMEGDVAELRYRASQETKTP
jgi:very-short-patch-repair endonuclease